MIYWAPLLHFYQPPTQTHWVLDKVCDECYRPLLNMFRSNPEAKVTVNICAVLTELLMQHGKTDVVRGLAELAERGQVEFTGSAKYHPILPLIPQEEMLRQIIMNYKTNQQFFGSIYAPKGFFPPEMCYRRDIVKPVFETGHKWIILSGIACPTTWPTDIIHQITADGGNLAIFFRDDILSNMISFRNIDAKSFLEHLRALEGDREDVYVVTAMDAETFGHHIKSWEKVFLEEVYLALGSGSSELVKEGVQELRTLLDRQKKAISLRTEVKEIRVVTISELLNLFSQKVFLEPRPSSWSTTEDDLKAGNPYPLWDAPNNQIHQLLWEHLHLTIEMVKEAVAAADNEISRYHADIASGLLDRAFHSDQFWWASKRPNWDINLINRGLMEQHEALLNGYKALKASTGLSSHEKRECYYHEIAAREVRAQIRDQLFGV